MSLFVVESEVADIMIERLWYELTYQVIKNTALKLLGWYYVQVVHTVLKFILNAHS